ncbi:hypothetical protein POUND7_000981 [Theobroma cacao]
MAAASPMASHLKSSFTSPISRALVSPKVPFASPLRVLLSRRQSSFTIRAVQSEKPTYQVIQPINGDPFIGSLETPITSSPLIAWYLSNLPAYRTAVSPLLRGIEVGLAHGFLLVGPFVKAGPLRSTPVAGGAGSLAAAGLVVILSICLSMYGVASFKEGEPSTAPSLTLTGRKKEPDQLQTAEGWASFTGGFFFGGISGVTWAYFLLYVLNLPYFFK